MGLLDRTWILAGLGILVFMLSSIAGAFSPAGLKEELFSSFEERAREIERAASSQGILSLPLLIFANNMLVSLIILGLSPTIAGPWIFMGYQGFVTGAVITYPYIDQVLQSQLARAGISCTLGPWESVAVKLALLIPHGILEIPGISLFLASATLISSAILSLAAWRLGRRGERPQLGGRLRRSGKLALVGALALLAAASIESFVTPVVGGVVLAIACAAG